MSSIFLGHNIIKRHHTIEPAIGCFPEEEHSYLLAKKLIYGLPVAITVAAVIDTILVIVYMKWIHPWCGLIKPTPINNDKEK